MKSINTYLSNDSNEAARNAIFITGSARSGTSIVGSLIHSMQAVEYAYEPPTLGALLALMDEMKPEVWRAMYETYIYEEILLNSVSGRYINCNSKDFSSIYKVKSLDEITSRLDKQLGRKECKEAAQSSVVAFKLPDMIYSLGQFQLFYPDARIVVVLRKGLEIIASILEKEWFNPEFDRLDLTNPCRIFESYRIPHFVPKEKERYWLGLDEVNRAAYYYILVNEGLADIMGRLEIKYSNLLENPQKEVSTLAEKLGLSFGDKTKDLIAAIKDSGSIRDIGILDKIEPSLREGVEYYSSIS